MAEPTVTRWTWERAVRASGLSQRARLAALVLATYMDARRGDTRDAHGRDHAPGMLTLAAGMGYRSRDSAQAAVGELVDDGWLVVEAGGGRKRPNRYLARTPETADEGSAVPAAEKLPTHSAGAGSIGSDTAHSGRGSIDEELPSVEPAPSDREEETTSSTGPSEQEAEALAVLAAGVPMRALLDRYAPWAEIRQRTMAAALVRTAYREVRRHRDEGDEGDEELSASSHRLRAAACRDFPAMGRGQQRDRRHDRHRAGQRDQQRDGQCDRQRDRRADPQSRGADRQTDPS